MSALPASTLNERQFGHHRDPYVWPELHVDHGVLFPDRKRMTLADYLEQVLEALIRAYNTRNRSTLHDVASRIFAPTFQIDVEKPCHHLSESLTPEAHIENALAYMEEYPGLQLESFNPTAIVDEKNGKAQLITGTEVTGSFESNLQFMRESYVIYHFQRMKHDEWLCTSVRKLRGPARQLFGIVVGS